MSYYNKKRFIDLVSTELSEMGYKVFEYSYHIEIYRNSFKLAVSKETFKVYEELYDSPLSTVYSLDSEFNYRYDRWRSKHAIK